MAQNKSKRHSGHGSTPNMADNAVMRMNKVIDKLGNYQAETIYVPTLKSSLLKWQSTTPNLNEMFSRLLANPSQSEQILDELAKKDRALAEEIRPRTKMTIAPTMIHGGVKENIIPSECEVVFDCRILPGKTLMKRLI